VRAQAAELALARGEDAVAALASDLDPQTDVQASAATRRHLAGVLLRRVATQLAEARP
jgi:carbon-monoxide dehydrogenase medium subunit